MVKRDPEPTNRELLKAIHEVAEAVQTLAGLTDRRFTRVEKILAQHSQVLAQHCQVLSQHTGALAELLVTTRRLDQERLVEHHRLNHVIDDVKNLQEAH